MPEIKNIFNEGKMDKDLDERLVTNGQYRNAMNIQVSTSEASDVGTVTNILGNLDIFPYIPMYSNSTVPTRSSQLSPTAKCIGCVADEKNDCFYWFVYHTTKSLILKYDNGGNITFVFVDVTNNVLEFSSKIITGINIIDNYLFWTDGLTEPKKIDVKLSEQGTHQGGHYNTRIVVPKRGINFNTNFVATKEHITVIKKAPKSKLIVEPIYAVDISATSPTNIPGAIGDVGLIVFDNYIPNGTTFRENDIVKLLDDNSANSIEDSHDLRIRILEDMGEFTIFSITIQIFKYKILSRRDSLASLGVSWNAELEIDDAQIFPKKFIRFGYRYKYQSSEYSSFSPFTDNIFKPGLFDYSPKKAHNSAMENNLMSLKLRNFIAKDMPLDVVQIDILYTESDSPTIYIVDKIKYSDTANVYLGQNYMGTGPSSLHKTNNWGANLYEITSDLIYAAVPENQLVRSYDSVPLTALAQEVTGSRIVYANYEQNYDIHTKPILLADIESRFTNNYYHVNQYIQNYTNDRVQNGQNPIPIKESVVPYLGQKSLKTIRDYQLGVTYLDEYGRETPIFSSEESQFKIKKKFADNKLKIGGRVTTQPPSWAESMKIYVKETSTEYYNLALSRVYRAEDGDLWLAFPSSERNKITEDTFLILKKAVDSTSLIESEAKYNVLAIENEAPEYIKEQITELVSLPVGDDGVVNAGHIVHGANYPDVDSRYFDIDEQIYSNQFGSPKHLNVIEENLYVAFKNQEGEFSSRYKVTHVGGGYDAIALTTTNYTVTLDRTFTVSDANFLFPDYPTTENTSGEVNISQGMQIIFYTGAVENKPEFKGVFFVKINSDSIAEKEIVAGYDTIATYEVLETAQAYYLSDNDATFPNTSTTLTSNTSIDTTNVLYSLNPAAGDGETTPSHGATNAFEEWNELHHWGQNASSPNPVFQGATPGPIGGFFIDKACYVATHPTGETNNNDWDYTNPGNNPNHVLGSDIHGDYTNLYSDPPRITSPKFGKGIYKENGKWYMELSFTMCGDNADPNDNRGYKAIYDTDIEWNNCNKGIIWEPENSALNRSQYQTLYGGDADGLATVIGKIRSGSYFKFQNQTTSTAFRINGMTKQKRYNYLNPISLIGSSFQFAIDVGVLNNGDANNGWSGGISGNIPGIGMTGGFKQAYERFVSSENRRVTYILELGTQNMGDIEINTGGQNTTPLLDLIDADSSIAIQFVDLKVPYETTTRNIISNNPAVFETEPVKTADLNIYYEATDSLPLIITQKNVERFIPNAAVITSPGRDAMHPFEMDYVVSTNGNLITAVYGPDLISMLGPLSIQGPLEPVRLHFTREDDSYTTAFIDMDRTEQEQIAGNIQPNQFYIESNVSKNPFALSWFNCFTFNNGVESNRIRDTFNEVTLDKGVKANSVIDSVYEKEKRKSGLIFSGIYNSNAGVNNLNQFIAAEGITKDLNPTYGSIQKLFQRKDDLIAFCEDKIVRIKANKDTLFNADGSSNVIATNKVLGEASPFAGDYGISKNPESFSKDNYRLYFTDKQRGAVLRLSMDGITPISEYGMSTFFKSRLGDQPVLGTYDNNKEEYNLTHLPALGTISYKEAVRGWSSFKSFLPEHGLSLSNKYFTFKNGIPYRHHEGTVERNTFYGHHSPSSVTVMLNNEPSIIKSFKTLGYEGSQSKVEQELSRVESGYYNLEEKDGWYSDLIQTDKQKGSVNEFIEKEGKWFNNIKSFRQDSSDARNIDTDEFQFQGIGKAMGMIVDLAVDPPIYGCMDQNATNFDPDATLADNTLCTYVQPPTPTIIGGCMDPLAPNFDATATFDDGSCVYVPPAIVYGCTTPGNFNYDPLATVDDGSCQPIIMGCLDPNAINYYSGANIDDGSCLYNTSFGCTDPQATNYAPLAQIDDGSCIYIGPPIFGCTDPIAVNYDPNATSDDGSCTYITGCTDPNATNYDPLATVDDGSCTYPPVSGCTDPTATNYNPLATVDDGSCTYPPPPPVNLFTLQDINDDDQ